MNRSDLNINCNRDGKGDGIGGRIWFSLGMRTILFFLVGASFAGVYALTGNEEPIKAAEKWWPFQAIIANVFTYLILRNFLSKEGLKYRSVFHFKSGSKKKILFQTTWLLLIGFVLGGGSLYFFSFLLLGSFIPPVIMFQEIPGWALIVAFLLFPLSNALVETPTYIGYALPRIEQRTGKPLLAIILAGLALSLQHIALPMVFDIPYMTWRFVSFIPLAIALCFIFLKTRNLLPIIIVHFIMDLQLVVQLALMIYVS